MHLVPLNAEEIAPDVAPDVDTPGRLHEEPICLFGDIEAGGSAILEAQKSDSKHIPPGIPFLTKPAFGPTVNNDVAEIVTKTGSYIMT